MTEHAKRFNEGKPELDYILTYSGCGRLFHASVFRGTIKELSAWYRGVPADIGYVLETFREEAPIGWQERLARTHMYGATKYAVGDYLIGADWRQYCAAFLRHVIALDNGAAVDDEGNNHLGACAFNILMLHHCVMNKLGVDNRIRTPTQYDMPEPSTDPVTIFGERLIHRYVAGKAATPDRHEELKERHEKELVTATLPNLPSGAERAGGAVDKDTSVCAARANGKHLWYRETGVVRCWECDEKPDIGPARCEKRKSHLWLHGKCSDCGADARSPLDSGIPELPRMQPVRAGDRSVCPDPVLPKAEQSCQHNWTTSHERDTTCNLCGESW